MSEQMTNHDCLLYAALDLVEKQDAGKDTAAARLFYDQCRAIYDAEKAELEAWIASRPWNRETTG